VICEDHSLQYSYPTVALDFLMEVPLPIKIAARRSPIHSRRLPPLQNSYIWILEIISSNLSFGAKCASDTEYVQVRKNGSEKSHEVSYPLADAMD
jgi:hypothetical protein